MEEGEEEDSKTNNQTKTKKREKVIGLFFSQSERLSAFLGSVLIMRMCVCFYMLAHRHIHTRMHTHVLQ